MNNDYIFQFSFWTLFWDTLCTMCTGNLSTKLNCVEKPTIMYYMHSMHGVNSHHQNNHYSFNDSLLMVWSYLPENHNVLLRTKKLCKILCQQEY